MDYEELEEELKTKRSELKNIKHALEKLKEVLSNIGDITYEGVNASFDKLEEEYNFLGEVKTGLKIDIDDIENQMAILEDAYDEFAERNSEYWASQF